MTAGIILGAIASPLLLWGLLELTLRWIEPPRTTFAKRMAGECE